MLLDFDPSDAAAIQAFLATLKPREELAYRMALRDLFVRYRGGLWRGRYNELMAEYATSAEAVAPVLKRSIAIKKRIIRLGLAK